MTRRGRRTSAADILAGLRGTPPAKERLLAIVSNLGGAIPASQAAMRLRLSPAMFRRLRTGMLEASLGFLEPRPRGRPVRDVPRHVAEIRKLLCRVADLEEELELSRVREEIALLLPWTRRGQKKTPRIRPRTRAGTPSGSPAA